jgi:hypothetical protein
MDLNFRSNSVFPPRIKRPSLEWRQAWQLQRTEGRACVAKATQSGHDIDPWNADTDAAIDGGTM